MNPEDPQTTSSAELATPPAQDTGFSARHLPGTPAGELKGMLPGMAAIGMYVLFTSMYTAFKMTHAVTMPASSRYSILAISTLVIVGVFGLLRLRRWGWSLVLGGCLMGAIANFRAFHETHVGGYLIEGLFAMLFFLYLSRTEVRERLH
jgi:hypothetical protein